MRWLERRPLGWVIPRAIALATALALVGCADFSADGGLAPVRQAAQTHLGKDVIWARTEEDRTALSTRVAQLLKSPRLSLDEAVQIALFNNPGLQAAYHELGISEAQLVRAAQLPNPHLAMLRASAPIDGLRQYKIEQILTFNPFALVTMAYARRIEAHRFEQTQKRVALQMLQLAAQTRRAWFEAVTLSQMHAYALQVQAVAQSGAQLADRMRRAGNFNALQQAREQSFHAEAQLAVARAQRQADAARQRLTQAMGLSDPLSVPVLADRLPDLPEAVREATDVQRMAMDQRLDLAAARAQTEALAQQLGLERVTRFVNVIDLGPARVLEGAGSAPYKNGYEIGFELPIFDWGGARVALAESIYRRQLEQVSQTVLNAQVEVREAYETYRSSLQIARHYRDQIVPLRRRISEENLLRYNAMQLGVFELLADARAQVAAVTEAIQAQRDFWIAQSDLEMALLGPIHPTALDNPS
jgi:outer membrane protein TolC